MEAAVPEACYFPIDLAVIQRLKQRGMVAHLQQNLAAAECELPDDAVKELDGVASIGSA